VKNNQSFSEWLDTTTKRAMNVVEASNLTVQKEARGNTRQDMSRLVLEQLLENGYQTVEWDSGHTTCGKCLELHRQQWTLSDFLMGLEHDAPIFEKSHPGDVSCTVLVSGDNLPTVRVDSYGQVDEV
jgi:hypothetical protein